MNTSKLAMPEGVKQYKVTWLDPLNSVSLYSKMFDSQVDAIMYARGLDKNFDWLMFNYKGLNKGVYTWELVPTGAYKSYQYGMIISEFALATVIGMVLLHYLLK